MAMDLEAYLDAQAALLWLPIAPEHRPGVLLYLQLAAGMAARVMDFELGPADEPGNVFVPVAPVPPVSPDTPTLSAGEGPGRAA